MSLHPDAVTTRAHYLKQRGSADEGFAFDVPYTVRDDICGRMGKSAADAAFHFAYLTALTGGTLEEIRVAGRVAANRCYTD